MGGELGRREPACQVDFAPPHVELGEVIGQPADRGGRKLEFETRSFVLEEPPGGLPKVDREFYVMHGELYTDRPFGQRGHDEFSVEKLLGERAEYFVFNGAVGALTTEHPMKAKVGETVRIFFGVGGPNATSSFHVIGEIFDRVYKEAAMGTPPVSNVQTTMVPAGGATIVEFKLDVPGRYILVDHSLSRLERGLAGFLVVEGDANPVVFHGATESGMSGH